jgi:hypothetical protein
MLAIGRRVLDFRVQLAPTNTTKPAFVPGFSAEVLLLQWI